MTNFCHNGPFSHHKIVNMTAIFLATLIAAAIISTTLSVILIGHLRRHRKTNDLENEFNRLADKYGLSISKKDVFGDRIIGLDEANGNLILVARGNEAHILDLYDIKKATVKKEYGLVFDEHAKRKGATTAVKRIYVELVYTNRAAPIVLSLYDGDNRQKLKRKQVVVMTAKWEKLIGGALPTHVDATKKFPQAYPKMQVETV